MPMKDLLVLKSSGINIVNRKVSDSKATRKRGGVAKRTDSDRRWTRSSVRQSIASHMDDQDHIRPAGRGESLFSINGSPIASDREVDLTRLSRRITLKGLNDDIELSCVLPTQDASSAGSKIAIESLEKEELIKMRDALKKAQEQAESLLAQYGL